MQLTLRYDRAGLPITLPDDLDVQILHLNPLPPLENPTQAIADSFENPIGSPPLREMARGRTSACIVISDVTRPVPNEAILTPMLRILEESGIARDKICILNATGLHRPNEGEELEEMIGAYIKNNYRVENHFARDTSTHKSLGEVEIGDGQTAQVALNAEYLDADLKITTGLIEPHFMAGYSGGRKLICPGIASADTILQFHAPPMIGHPQSRTGNLVNNPIHAMSRAVAGIAGCDFICNVTLSEDRQITGVFSGDMDEAHLAGIARLDQQTKVPCEAADIVITTSAGYPLDTTLYQTVKGMVGALPAIKQGGTMIIASGMSQGTGGEEFTNKCSEIDGVESFMDKLFNSPVDIDQWQLQEMMLALRKCEIMIVTDGVDHDFLRRCLLQPMPSVEAALELALERQGRDAKITIIPEGPYVTPVAEEFATVA